VTPGLIVLALAGMVQQTFEDRPNQALFALALIVFVFALIRYLDARASA
jgi:hypothetical protein